MIMITFPAINFLQVWRKIPQRKDRFLKPDKRHPPNEKRKLNQLKTSLIFLDSQEWFQSCQADHWDGSTDKADADADQHGNNTIHDVEQ